MKKKYFFGLFICLVLLCSGVFLLATNNFNTVEQIIINDQADAVDIAITVTIGKVYGLGGQYISGATFNITVGREDKNGGNRKAGSTFGLSTYPASSHEGKVDASWLANYRYMTINSTTIVSGGKDGDSTITTNYGWIESNRGSGGITGFRVRHDTADAYREGSFTLDIYWGIKYNCKYENGTGGSTNFYFSTKDNVAKTKPTIPTRTGYKFNGYYTATSGGTQVINANGNWTNAWTRSTAKPAQLHAQWTPNTYTIKYDGNGATGGSTASSSHTYDSSKTLTKNGFEKEGYHFVGWSTTRNGSKAYSDGQSVKNLTSTNGGTITLYARWERNNYKIDINFYKPNGSTQNGGTFDLYKQLSGGSETLIQEGLSNEIEGSAYLQYEGKFILKKITPLTGTTIDSVRLSNGDGTLSTSGKTINGKTIIDTITYTASQTGPPSGSWDNAILIYTTSNSLKATLNYQDDLTKSTEEKGIYNTNGTKLNLPSPTRKGYTFKGWSLTPNGTGDYNANTDWNNITVNGTTVSTPNAGEISFNLYAIWQANDYKVTLNDGEGAVSSLVDMTWISGATFNGTTYTYNANGITSTYNTATGDFKINGTPSSLGMTLLEGEQYKIEVTPKEGNMLEYNQNGLFVFEVCDENGNNLSSRQFNNLKEIPTTAYNATFSSTLKISANSATNGAGLKLWYWVAGTPASQMFTNYTINIKITKVGSTQNVNKKS